MDVALKPNSDPERARNIRKPIFTGISGLTALLTNL